MPAFPLPLEDDVMKRVSDFVLGELARAWPDPADRALRLLEIAVSDIADLPEQDRLDLCTDAWRVFYLASQGDDLVEAFETVWEEQ